MINKLSQYQDQNILKRMQQMIQDAKNLGIVIPPEIQKADPQVIIDYLGNIQNTAKSTGQAVKNIEDASGKEKLIRQQLENQTQQVSIASFQQEKVCQVTDNELYTKVYNEELTRGHNKIMQKLSGELKNAPMDASLVCSPASMALNRDQSLSVPSKVLTDNNLEVNPVQHTGQQNLRVSAIVYAKNKCGKPLKSKYISTKRNDISSCIKITGKSVVNTMTAQRKVFNLKKAQYVDPSMDQEDIRIPSNMGTGMSELGSNVQFNDYAALKNWLDGLARTDAEYALMSLIQDEHQDAFRSLMQNYFEEGNIILTDSEKLDIAKQVWSMLPDSVKTEDTGEIEAPFRRANTEIVKFVDQINDEIKKMASTKKTKFNLSKFAQHKSNENVILYGPSSVRIDPFYRQPVSDWHILERNKGFGLVVDDVWNIDWEALWRGNVMDKYSRPYRDTKTGEWIGGYIQKRFEVDKWIPPENNYQLLPGQLRRPYIPEQRSTEARLEAMREKDAGQRGYAPVSTGNPFNWHTASSKKKS